MKAEFDHYIENNYREDDALSLTGYSYDFFARYKAEKLHTWITKSKLSPKSILDFGCGDGLMTSYVQQLFPEAAITGIDPSSKSIKTAQNNYPTITFKTSDILDYASAKFDVIFAACVFHHIPEAEQAFYVQQLKQLLNKNGVIVIFEMNPLNPVTRYMFKRIPVDKNATMIYPWELKKLFSLIGKPQINYYGFFPRLISFLQPLERYFELLPIGAHYALIVHKKSS